MTGLRTLPMVFSLLLFCTESIAQAPAPYSASLEGTIVNKDISNITVRLERTPINPLAYIDGYTATEEADGSFHFHDVEPGPYRLTAEAKLSMYGEYGSDSPRRPATILDVKPGDRLHGLSLELFPAPNSICGQVVDENGKPLQVDVEEYGTRNGYADNFEARQARVELPTRRTDANGYFSFPQIEDREEYFIRAGGVWYPSTEDFSKALPVKPTPRSGSGCQVKIQIRHSNCAGRVIGKAPENLRCAENEYDISLFGIHPSGALLLTDSQLLSLADGFEFDGVCDGSYAIVAKQKDYCTHQNQWQNFASAVFDVNDPTTAVALTDTTYEEIATIGAIQATQSQPVSVAVAIRTEGLRRDEACPTDRPAWIGLNSENPNGSPIPNKRLGAQGAVAFSGVRPGTYSLDFDLAMHGAMYLKSFEIDGRAADPANFTISSGQPNHVDVVLSNDPQESKGHLHADYSAPLHFIPEGAHPAGSVSGRVNGAEGKNAIVKLTATRFNSAKSALYQTVASESGAFHFDSVDPGIYRLFAEGGEIQYSAFGAKGPGLEGMPIVLSAGQHLDGVSFSAYRKSSLCGRVMDHGGKPLAGVEVSVQGYETATYSRSKGYTGWQKNSVTDGEGRYRIAEVGPDNFLWLWAESSGKRTYFPSARDTSQTQPIHLGTEDSACTYDIHLPAPESERYEHGYSVSGTIDGKIDSVLGRRFHLEVISDNPDYFLPIEPGEVGIGGKFALHDVWPGKYTLNLTTECDDTTVSCDPKNESIYFDGKHMRLPDRFFRRILASRRISVTNADIAGLTISLDAMSTLDGEIIIDGNKPKYESRSFDLALIEWSGKVENPRIENARLDILPDDNGHFSFKYLNARDYGFHLANILNNEYVKSIALDGEPINGRRIALRPGQSAHLVVHMATDGASGTMVPGPTQPSVDEYEDDCRYNGGRPMIIMMIPDALPADASGILVGYYQTDSNNLPDGIAHFSGVPPGHYHIVALDLLDQVHGLLMGANDAVFESHDGLLKLGAFGAPVEVISNQHFEWVAPVVTEQMMRLKAEMGLPATH